MLSYACKSSQSLRQTQTFLWVTRSWCLTSCGRARTNAVRRFRKKTAFAEQLHLNFHLALRRSFEPLWKVRVFAGMSHKGLQIQHLSSHQWMQPRLSHCCRFSFPDCRSCTDIHTASYCYHPQNKPNKSNRINQTVSTGLLVLPSPAVDWIILNRPSAVLCAVWWARIPWRCALAESIIPPWQPWATHDGEWTDVSKCKGDQKTWSWSNFQTATLPRLAPRHPAQDEEKATTSQR